MICIVYYVSCIIDNVLCIIVYLLRACYIILFLTMHLDY